MSWRLKLNVAAEKRSKTDRCLSPKHYAFTSTLGNMQLSNMVDADKEYEAICDKKAEENKNITNEGNVEKSEPEFYYNSYNMSPNINNKFNAIFRKEKDEPRTFLQSEPWPELLCFEEKAKKHNWMEKKKFPIPNMLKNEENRSNKGFGYPKLASQGQGEENLEDKVENEHSFENFLNPESNESLNSSYPKLMNSSIKIKPEEYDSEASTNLNEEKRQSSFIKNGLTVLDFEIGRLLGKGQYGEVRLARHKASNFICALKIIPKELAKENADKLIREISIQSYLNHPNIANLYSFFYDLYFVYLIVEFCCEGELFQKIKEKRQMEEKEASCIMKPILEAVEYMHRKQIIHRDLKPENILLTFNVPKICDFGWSIYDSIGFRKSIAGTPLYYPPEIVQNEYYDEKIDVWNLGMVTYECLLGKIPFRIYTFNDLQRIIHDEIEFPSYIEISPEAKSFIQGCLKKKPEERIRLREMLRHNFIGEHLDESKIKVCGVETLHTILSDYE